MIEYLLWAPDRATLLAVLTSLTNPLTGTPLVSEDAAGAVTTSLNVRLDEIGDIAKTPGDMVGGYHANMSAHGPLAGILISGLPQAEDADVFTRTHILGLMPREMAKVAKAANGVPGGYQGPTQVRVFDAATVRSRSRVWA